MYCAASWSVHVAVRVTCIIMSFHERCVCVCTYVCVNLASDACILEQCVCGCSSCCVCGVYVWQTQVENEH